MTTGMTTVAAVEPREWTEGPRVPVPAGTVADLVLARAAARPDAVAVRQWDARLAYGELAGRAARLAADLRALGAGPERRVGLCLRRRPELVVGVLGTLLSGAAYVPLDPDGPAARRAEILADADPVAVVADPDGTRALAEAGGTRRLPGADRPLVPVPGPGSVATPQPVPARPADAAYVLYTSGSTGRPKGVVVEHRAVTSFAVAFGGLTGVDAGTRAFGYAGLGFDVSVLDLLVPLAAGGQVALAAEADRTDPARLQRFAEEHRVTWGCLPVSLLPLLDPGRLPDWCTLITGAEAPGPEQVERWAGPAEAPVRRFLNCYGPTEATVCVTGFETAGRWDRPVPMGGPLPSQRAYVVDEAMRPVPPGTPGELLVGGTGLARGYLGRPGLTAARFVPDPFGPDPGARLYRTGDRVVRLPDGALLFLGRLDRQVKVRGQRVETGEVEAVLRAHPAVGHAVVEAVDGPAGTELVGFATAAAGGALDPDALRAHCRDRLPAAAVPARVVELDRFPLTASGKVDSAALLALAPGPSGRSGPAPDGPLERAVAEVWAPLLGVAGNAVGADDDFFAAGGHSITAMRLVADLRARTGRGISVEDVFAGRTVAGIAERAAAAAPLEGGDLPAGSPPAVSAAQRRLWFADKLAPESAAYNIALAERLLGPLDVPALRVALAEVARRHEVLRWRVPDSDGVPSVEVDPPVDAADLAVEEAGEQALPGRLAAAAAERFDLATGPLWRARLLRLGADDHVLALTFHHLVFDGWSQRPYLADLGRAYDAARAGREPRLPAPATRYADFVAWRAARDAARGAADLGWWTAHLAGAPAVLDLPRDRRRPPVQTHRGAQEATTLDPATAAGVRSIAARVGAPPPAVLFAAFAELAGRITGRADLVLGTPAADRRRAEFHPLVGFFVDVVPLRARLAAGATFAERVRAAADELVAVLARPSAPIERVVDALALPRDASRSALVQVLFNVYNFPEPRLALAGLRTERVAPGLPGSAFDLTGYVVDRDGTYAVEITYNPDLYDAARIRRLLRGYAALLDQLVAAPDAPVAAAHLPGATELSATAADSAATAADSAGDRTAGPGAAGGPKPGAAAREAGFGSAGVAAAAGSAPATETERVVAAVWEEILGRGPVRAIDAFFEVGGTSMAAVVAQSRLAARTGRDVRVVDLFRYPTVRALAAHLDGLAGGPGPVAAAGLDQAERRAAARRGRGRTRAAGRAGQPEGGS
ncbi:MAG: amino acid adenylation domain-containing protein [Mycobacteriales bacterium]